MASLYPDEYRKLIEALGAARRAAGMTQTELSKKLGQHQSLVSKIENGERRVDPIELKRIAAILGVRIAKSRLYAARRPLYHNQPANVRRIYLASGGALSLNEA